VAPAPVVESASALKEETALLAGANAALGRGDVKRAQALLADYDRRPGSGVLAEERTVTGILASCAAGRLDVARVEAQRFRARWPRSPLAARVDGSCAGKL
jgi:outer membrane protein assembly factor BamD (BamD/ComL family)